jgi:opacity protein-like surface antigen
MKAIFRCILAVTAFMFTFSAVYAQKDDYKWEGFVGYTYLNLNRGIDPDEVNNELSDFPANRVNAHGFNGSIAYNFSRYIGGKFDLTIHSNSDDFLSPLQISAPPAPPIAATLHSKQSVDQYLFGIQVKDNARDGKKLKPWAHILGGVAHQKFTIDETAPGSLNIFDISDNDFAMKFGGGLDWRVHKNIDIRVIQFDWNPIFRSDLNVGGRIGTIGSTLQNNYMFTWGLAFH